MELALSRISHLLHDSKKSLYSSERLMINDIAQTVFQADIRRTLLHEIPIGKIIIFTSSWGSLHVEYDFIYERLSNCIFDIEQDKNNGVCSFTIFATSSILLKDALLKVRMFQNNNLAKGNIVSDHNNNIKEKKINRLYYQSNKQFLLILLMLYFGDHKPLWSVAPSIVSMNC
jgi:hypothetical protein